MDPIQPIGAMVQPPQPINVLDTLKGVLGLQQQRQGLQIQQQELQGLTAESKQKQQQNQQLTAAQSVLQQVRTGQFRNSDGSLDRVGLADALTQIGPYAQSAATSVLGQANAIVQNKTALQNLSAAQQKQLAAATQELRQEGPNLNWDTVAQRFGTLAIQNPQMAPMLMRMLAYGKQTPNTSALEGPQLQDLMQKWSAQAGGLPLQQAENIQTPQG